MREQLREPALGAVPLNADGSAWAVATTGSLVVFNGCSRPKTHSWDGQERVFILRWSQQDREDLVLKVPAGVRNGDAYASADAAAFAKALRQRVEAAIVHSAVTTLPSGATATASVRRGSDGELYSVTRPLISQVDEVEDCQALQELEDRVREGVGLPTR